MTSPGRHRREGVEPDSAPEVLPAVAPADDAAAAATPAAATPVADAPVTDAAVAKDPSDAETTPAASRTTRATGNEAAADQATGNQATGNEAAKPRRRRRVLVPVLVVLVVAAGATDAWQVTHRPSTGRMAVVAADGTYDAGSQTDSAPGHALAAAVKAAPLLLSYDYRTLPANLAAALPTLTSTFAPMYSQAFTTSVEPAATTNMAVVQSLVRGGGVVDSTSTTATVLLFVDQTLVQTAGQTAPTVNQDRVTITLKKQGGSWLVDNVTPF